MKLFARIVFIIPLFGWLLVSCGGNAKPLNNEPSVESPKGTPLIEIAEDFFDFGIGAFPKIPETVRVKILFEPFLCPPILQLKIIKQYTAATFPSEQNL